jgi:hypothetical protein
MNRRLPGILTISVCVIATEWVVFFSQNFQNSAALGRDVNLAGLIWFMSWRTAFFAFAAVFPAAAFVSWRVGGQHVVSKVFVMTCTVLAMQFAVRHIWRMTVLDAELRARTLELKFGPLFLAIALIPACCHLLFRPPFRLGYQQWPDAILSLVLSVAAWWFWTP